MLSPSSQPTSQAANPSPWPLDLPYGRRMASMAKLTSCWFLQPTKKMFGLVGIVNFQKGLGEKVNESTELMTSDDWVFSAPSIHHLALSQDEKESKQRLPFSGLNTTAFPPMIQAYLEKKTKMMPLAKHISTDSTTPQSPPAPHLTRSVMCFAAYSRARLLSYFWEMFEPVPLI